MWGPSQNFLFQDSLVCNYPDDLPTSCFFFFSSGQAKTLGRDCSQSSFKPQSSSCQMRTRSIATSALPLANSIPKATSRIAILGRSAVSGRPSQLNAVSLGVPGAKGSTLPIPARKKGEETLGLVKMGLVKKNVLPGILDTGCHSSAKFSSPLWDQMLVLINVSH